eukprot:TRINITY_DN339_c0_g3_i2.p1 TRINITY_DN339_c0_g3~~TRINITY_DN339_c0_g3_i2.p1  ORF type:complete len:889 (+),score=191.51 TRINITY_DN339_c0_g3_i2:204-2870(+)
MRSASRSVSTSSPSVASSWLLLVLLSVFLVLFNAVSHGVSAKRHFELAPCLDEADQFPKDEIYDCIQRWLEDYEQYVHWDRVELEIKKTKSCSENFREDYRSSDGSCNHKAHEQKTVGMSGQPFTSLAVVADSDSLDLTDYSSLRNPDPLIISRVVAGATARKKSSFFMPSYSALTLSYFVWVFQDLYQFDQYDLDDRSISFDLPQTLPPIFAGYPPNSKVEVSKTKFDNDTLINQRTAFLDADNIYGPNADVKDRLRLDNGKIALEDKRLVRNKVGDKRTLNNYANAMWTTLWSREHNMIVDELISHYKRDGDRFFHEASLLVNAEIVKIMYQEVIPSFIGQPWALEFAKNAWHDDEPEHEIKYSTLIELLSITNWLYNPETIILRDTEGEIEDVSLSDKEALRLVLEERNGTDRVLISLAGYPSYPINLATVAGSTKEALNKQQSLCKNCYELMDRLALAIVQERELGVPRYNDLRRLLRLDPIKKFSDLTSNKYLVQALELVYEGDVEKLDFSVGALAEDHQEELPLPPTATYIFLYSLRRLQRTDRFFGSKLNVERIEKLLLNRLRGITFAQIIRENTQINDVPLYPFKVWTFNSTLNYPMKEQEIPRIHLSAFTYGYFLNVFIITIVGMWLISWLIEFFGRSFWFKFRKMALAHQRAVVSYILELLVQTAVLGWELYIYSTITWIDKDQDFQGNIIRQAVLACSIVGALYIWELIYRISLRGQILAHHLVVLILMMTIIYRLDYYDDSNTVHLVQPFTFLAMTAITEQPIFLALLLYRFDYKYSWLFYASAVQNFFTKLFLHAVGLYYYCVYVVHWDLFWAIYYPMIVLGLLLPAQIYAIYAQYVLGKRCVKKGKPVAVMAQSSGVMGKAFFPPPLLAMPSDL